MESMDSFNNVLMLNNILKSIIHWNPQIKVKVIIFP